MLASIAYLDSLRKPPELQKTMSSKMSSTIASGTQNNPVRPKTDSVTISSQAQALLVNSKTYTPAEEASEPAYEKAYEKRLGQR